MEENPYSGILGVIRRDADDRRCAAWRLGVVVSVAPLSVKTGGQVLFGGELLVNYQLRANTEPVKLSEAKGAFTASTDCSEGSITTIDVTDGTLEAVGLFGGVLVSGDQVAMLQSEDQQQFVVLCKVVGA